LRFLPVFAPGVLALMLSSGARPQEAKPDGPPERTLVPSRKNAAAEELESLVLPLGLDPRSGDPTAEHPSREDLEAFQRAGFGSWLEAQFKLPDDSIASVPANIQSFLERRQPTVWRVASLLERDVPLWESDPRASPRDLSGLRVAIPATRILLAAALVEERAGHHLQAGDLLEASWSLSRSLSGQPDLTSQLMAIALLKLQAGALRKMSDPPIPWLDRLSGDEPWRAILDAVEASPLISVRAGDASMDQVRSAETRAWRAMTDRLRPISPCEVSKLSSEEIWKPATEEIARSIKAGTDPVLRTLSDIATPNITSLIRRAGRLLVDRELTAKVLELRQEKAASRDGSWPAKFYDGDSRVCPGAEYEYQTRAGAMAIRFKGAIDDPPAPAIALPLSFEVRAPRPTPTPGRPRRLTVTPGPGLDTRSPPGVTSRPS
jgi:hypothetical protein